MDIEIRNCSFKFRCEKTWNELEKGKDPKIRYCKNCKEDVYYVRTDKELRSAIEHDFCVAIEINEKIYLGDVVVNYKSP
jgi:Zn finger protein HypA/HybF involved in hydrogenase expression